MAQGYQKNNIEIKQFGDEVTVQLTDQTQ